MRQIIIENKNKAMLFMLALVLLSVGCSSKIQMVEPPMKMAREEAFRAESKPQLNEGSIYQEASAFTDLFVNPKAKRVGDIITIKIVENSTAKNNASTNTGRSSSLTGQLNSMFNLENKYTPTQNTFNPFGAINAGLDTEFKGSGTTSRSGDLSAYITAKVVDVLPNGNLMISGTREVQINHEKQYIMLQGTIRPRDISPENVILSTYISEAKIAYSGSGVVDKRQRPGWLANILEVAWPF
ncbi:MAG: flagellar basal body L-ring protein FlgH [Proteobacteria bacterium]|nr:flagellar basal body L-ring protein FlgH [Pseudomonadota bacterium]MBU4471527.1 flagellar basal body L-ring protein FlgH [Pseudomonadota bacterium]MCG2752533.1 flagellar basal body L-ring protein FlgH [Desulfobacteraceae bacterium]